MTFPQRLSHNVIQNGLSYHVFLTTSFRHLSHNAFCTTSLSQRLSHNVLSHNDFLTTFFLITSFSLHLSHNNFLTTSISQHIFTTSFSQRLSYKEFLTEQSLSMLYVQPAAISTILAIKLDEL